MRDSRTVGLYSNVGICLVGQNLRFGCDFRSGGSNDFGGSSCCGPSAPRYLDRLQVWDAECAHHYSSFCDFFSSLNLVASFSNFEILLLLEFCYLCGVWLLNMHCASGWTTVPHRLFTHHNLLNRWGAAHRFHLQRTYDSCCEKIPHQGENWSWRLFFIR